MRYETVEHLTPEQLDALLASYDREARRLRSATLKSAYSQAFSTIRNMLKSTFIQQHKLAHASE